MAAEEVPPLAPDSHVLLIGPMAVGKSAVGRALAKQLGRRFIDTDEEIEESEGSTGREIAARSGVAELHRIEAAVVAGALESAEPLVVAAAASVADDAEWLAGLTRAGVWVGYLDASKEVLSNRTAASRHRRPMEPAAAVSAAATRLHNARRAGCLVVDTTRATIDRVVALIIAGFEVP